MMSIRIVLIAMTLSLIATGGISAQVNTTVPAKTEPGQAVLPAESKTAGESKPVPGPEIENTFAGEFRGWGIKVPANNYNFIKGTILIFGNQSGVVINNDEDLENVVWEQLLLSFEAFRRGINVEPRELEEQITRVLENSKINFDWKQNRNAYAMWVRDKLREPVEVFENQLRHLIQLDKLRRQVLDSLKPEISEDELRQAFRNEFNTIGLELVQFDDLRLAQDFYGRMKEPGLWDEKAKSDPKFSKRLGFVSFEFLIDLWKIPSEDLYKMLKMDINSIYPPTPIYRGYGVFRILEKRPADENEFQKARDGYFKKVESRKKYEGLGAWIQKLKDEARIDPVWQVG